MARETITYTAHVRAILALGLPLIGGHLAQFAIGLTDAVMLGWYGVEALAAKHDPVAPHMAQHNMCMRRGTAAARCPQCCQQLVRHGDRVNCAPADVVAAWSDACGRATHGIRQRPCECSF